MQATVQLEQTDDFTAWLAGLRDRRARSKMIQRLARCEQGNAGLTRSVGSGVFEIKIDYGPGYRLYYVRRGSRLILLLCGGDKSSQTIDIERAKVLANSTTS